MVAALVFALVALTSCSTRSVLFVSTAVVSVALLVPVIGRSVLPDVHTEDRKEHAPVTEFTAWGPVFRVDAVKPPGGDGSNLLLLHDGTFGSG